MARVQIDFPARVAFSTEIGIRVDDINFGGHLAHDSILTLMHEARARYFRSLGYAELDIEGKGIVVADAAISYRSEAFYGETLRVDVGIDDIQNKAFDLIYRLLEKASGREVALGKTAIVFFDYGLRKAVEIPSVFLPLLNRPLLP